MSRYNISCKDAYNFVKQSRPIVNPNPQFMRILNDYDSELVRARLLKRIKRFMMINDDDGDNDKCNNMCRNDLNPVLSSSTMQPDPTNFNILRFICKSVKNILSHPFSCYWLCI